MAKTRKGARRGRQTRRRKMRGGENNNAVNNTPTETINMSIYEKLFIPTPLNDTKKKYLERLFSMEGYNWLKEAGVARELIPWLNQMRCSAASAKTKAMTRISFGDAELFEVLKPYLPKLIERLTKAQQGKLIKSMGDLRPAISVLSSLLSGTQEVECKAIENAIEGLENYYGLLSLKKLKAAQNSLKNRTTYVFDLHEEYKLAKKMARRYLGENDPLLNAPVDVLVLKFDIDRQANLLNPKTKPDDRFYNVRSYLRDLDKWATVVNRNKERKASGSPKSTEGLKTLAIQSAFSL